MPPGGHIALGLRRPALAGLCAAALTLLALTATAQAVTLVSPSGDPRVARFQTWANSAAVPTPAGVVDLVLDTCPVAVSDGCIYHGAPPTIYLGPTVRDRPILLHELGHAFDTQRLTPGYRAAFEGIFRDTRAWRAPPNSPHERFAEAYSLCARHARIARTYTAAYGYRATPRQHRSVCALIKRAGAAATSAISAPFAPGGFE
jgi:hypothetical protein